MTKNIKENVVYYSIYMLGFCGIFFYNKKTKLNDINHDKIICENTVKDDTTYLFRTTFYNPTFSQCDSNPYITADNSYIDTNKLKNNKLKWVALSQDLIHDEYKAKVNPGFFKGKFKFGDTIKVVSEKHPYMNGNYVVRDVMNKRYRNSMDFLLPIKDHYRFGLGRDFKICNNKSQKLIKYINN